MKDKAILVFGGVGGIGEALARRLAGAGTHVTVTSRSRERATALAEAIGGTPAVVEIADDASIEGAVRTAASGGRLDGLAYCIGSIPLKPLARITGSDLTEAFRLNVAGALVAARAAAEPLKAAGGAMVLFSSIAARQGFPNHAVIGTAKAAVEGLTLALAAEFAPHARVNAIAPSLTRTPLAATMTANDTMAKAIAALHPLPRLGEAEEMAALAAFLLSPDAGWITGQVIGVDGGRSTLQTGRK